jgi:pyrophosphatase PpaX
MSFKYILFDWDGTLANTLPLWLKVYRELYKSYGVEVSDQEIAEKSFGNLKAPSLYGLDADEFQSKLEVIAMNEVTKADLYSGAREALKVLKAEGGKLVIVTTNVRDVINAALEYSNLKDEIDYVVSADDVTNQKPSPECIEIVIDYFQADKSELVIIGDSGKDINCGKAAGIHTIMYFPEEHASVYGADYAKSLNSDSVFNDYDELLKILL